ncbi:MAG: helicase HerA-like domain-containing protein [Methanoculleus sp.]
MVEQSCYAYTSGPLVALREAGLIDSVSRRGTTIIRTTPAGKAIARPLMEARLQALDVMGLAREIHEIVPILLAGTVKGPYVNKTLPSALPEAEETFIDFLFNNNPALFFECEQFAARLKAAGCAVFTCGPDGPGAGAATYTFPPEFAYILKGMLETIEPGVREHYDMLLESFHSTFTVLRYLAWNEGGDRIRASSAHRRELSRVLGLLTDSIHLLEGEPRGGGRDLPGFIIRDQDLYDAHIRDLGRELMADVAEGIAIARPPAAPVPKPAPPPPVEPPFPGEEERGDEDQVEEMPAPAPRPGGLDIFLGHAPDGQRVNWSPGRLNNGHMIVLGGSGAGKTETIRCIALELAAQALPVIMIDFHGDMAPDTDGIRAYKIREGGEYYFNPLGSTPPSMRSHRSAPHRTSSTRSPSTSRHSGSSSAGRSRISSGDATGHQGSQVRPQPGRGCSTSTISKKRSQPARMKRSRPISKTYSTTNSSPGRRRYPSPPYSQAGSPTST